MKKAEESEDVESAYGSEISSNSKFLTKKGTFTIEDSEQKSRRRCRLEDKLWKFMVLEAVVFLILVFLLISCCRITSQNQETQKMISGIQSELDSFQKGATGEDFMKTKQQKIKEIIKEECEKMRKETEEMMQNEYEKIKELLDVYLKGVRIQPEGVSKEVKTNSAEQLEPSIIHNPTKLEKAKTFPKIPTVSTNSTLKRFNAASLIAGATVDSYRSSSSNLNPSFGFDQSSLVLVDRPDPPASKAWCTYDKTPVLTVSLAKYIKPTSVSYQHSKWNGIIPNDAPRIYDVKACLDQHCKHLTPLLSSCYYNSDGNQEQACNIPNDSIHSPVGKLQFRFQRNQGNTERTCVSLLRVYSETEVIPEQKSRTLEDTATCLDLKNDYHNNKNIYKYKNKKNCNILYSKGCCQECPECCEECEIKDINGEVILSCIVISVLLLTLAFPFFFIFFMHWKKVRALYL